MISNNKITDIASLNIHLLYLEDDERLAQSMQKIMANLSIRVRHFPDPVKALEALNREVFDLILSDVKMPQMDGITFAKKLRDNNNNIPIILISNHQEAEDLRKAIPLQLIDYLVKPVSLDKLLDVFGRALHGSRKTSDGICLHPNVFYDNTTKTVFHKDTDQSIPLGRREWELLELLLANRNRYVTIEIIESVVYEGMLSESSLRNTVMRLREKTKNKTLIKNYRELGYMLK